MQDSGISSRLRYCGSREALDGYSEEFEHYKFEKLNTRKFC